MPLPLIAIGVGAAAIGIGGTAVAITMMGRAKSRYNERRERYEASYKPYRDFVKSVNADLWELHQRRVAASETLREAADFLVKAEVQDRSWNPKFGISREQFAELKGVIASLGNITASTVGAAAGGAAAGAGVAAGAYAAAAAFGTASTGAAISSLTGIAARNATLAWLGRGALAAGGMGMAGGVAMIANIVLAPLSIVPAVIMGLKARRQIRAIDAAIEKMRVSRADIRRHRAELTAVRSRASEVHKAVEETERALKDILRTASLDSIEEVHRVYLAAKALADLLELDSEPSQLPSPNGKGG